MGKILLTMLLSSLIGFSWAATTTGTTKSTATLSTTCTINATTVSFGNIILPLSAQGATGNMTVLCNKGAAYNIGLAYGGVYGKGSAGSDYYVDVIGGNWCVGYGKAFNHYDVNNVYLGKACQGTIANYSSLTDATIDGQARKYTGAVPGASYDYGILSGVRGDSIAYSISLPNDTSKVWNAGNNSYSDTGIGTSQNISVRAKLVPSKSSSMNPTPDMYMDSVTATITY